jgi:DNA polymerase III subunit epsilon
VGDLRKIVLDTETTGLSVKDGHKIIEIGCTELVGRMRTGKTFHVYINPKRKIDKAAYEVHGISDQFVADKPLFVDIAQDFLKFIGNSNLIIHNAAFDMRFLNHELSCASLPLIPMHRAIDTLLLARKKFPGAQASLDALCRKFNISLQSRTKHGALIDSELLALVYLELVGNKQPQMSLYNAESAQYLNGVVKQLHPKRSFALSAEEIATHEEVLRKIKDPLWKNESNT